MNKNPDEKININQSNMSETNEKQTKRNNFLKKVAFLASIHAKNQLKYINSYSDGTIYTILKTEANKNQIQEDIQSILNISFNQFNRIMDKFGFATTITSSIEYPKTQKIVYKLKQKYLNRSYSDISQKQEDSQSDQFPKQSQINAINKFKQSQNKGFIKPNIILNKFQSQNILLTTQKPKYDEISLEVKLNREELFNTPLGNQRKQSELSGKNNTQEQKLNQISILNSGQIYRENYQKSSQLINQTINEILLAHQSKSIEKNNDKILNKITEVYDFLTENIEIVYQIENLSKNQQVKSMLQAKIKKTNEKNQFQDNLPLSFIDKN